MPANKYALLRYRIIDRCLNNRARPYPSKEDLREACEEALYGSLGEHISPSTIEKDLWAMRNESELGYYAPIEYHLGHKGYYYSDPEYSINDLSLNDSDLLAIKFAASTLQQFRDIPIFEQYVSAIDKIVNRVSISPSEEQKSSEVVQFENSTSAKGSEFLEEIYNSILSRNQLQIEYKKFNSDESKTYSVHPYLLKEYRNRWYLICFVIESGRIQTFGLERIVDLSILDSGFEPSPDFNADLFFKHSIGITQLGDEPKKIELKVNELQAQYLRSQPIHHSQVITEKDNGQWHLELYALETYELVSFILSLGKDVVVIKPESLKRSILDQINSARGNYS